MRDNKRGTIEDRSVDASLDLYSVKVQPRVVNELSLGASRALALFADELEALKAQGEPLAYERIIDALREVSEKASRGL